MLVSKTNYNGCMPSATTQQQRTQQQGTQQQRRADELVGGGEEELATRLRVAVTRLNRRLRQQSLAGLSPSQAAALGSINRLGTPTLGELALAEQVQPPTMTRLVAAMERQGLVVRFQDEQDRRVWRARLSVEGRRALQRIHHLKNAFLVRRMADLDEAERAQVRQLPELLERLVADR